MGRRWGKQMSIRLYEMCLEAVRAAYTEQFTYHLLGGPAFRRLEHAANCADDFIQVAYSGARRQCAAARRERRQRGAMARWLSGLSASNILLEAKQQQQRSRLDEVADDFIQVAYSGAPRRFSQHCGKAICFGRRHTILSALSQRRERRHAAALWRGV